MVTARQLLTRSAPYIGAIGTVASIVLFIIRPSWPTPDKLLVFLTLVFMIFRKAMAMLKRLGPFVLTLLLYESFRGLAPLLNKRVEYDLMVHIDKFLGGGTLPTSWLQSHIWKGSAQWFDYGLYLVYMLHFILPLTVALLIWKNKVALYWRYVATFVLVSFMGFLTFVAMPAAPPWMAARDGHIEQITRISSSVWFGLGIKDFPSVYNKLSPNPVAAVPSLHAAYATLLALYIRKAFGRKWGLVALIYPILIYFGTVYQGEHYLIDELLGSLYAVIAYASMVRVYPRVRSILLELRSRTHHILWKKHSSSTI